MTTVLEIEEAAFRAWPAAEVREVDGWRLRYMSGVTRRANSVWPNRSTGLLSLGARLEAVEAFYRERGQPAQLQMAPCAEPPDLDRELAARGYQLESRTLVQVVALTDFRGLGTPPQITTRVDRSPSEEWLRLSTTRGRFAGVEATYLGLLERIGARGGFAVAHLRGEPVAIGLGVLDEGLVGVFNMLTLPEARRRRAATAILGAIVGWGVAAGASRAYLQVEAENGGAVRLYEASGFQTEYEYHYRVKRA
jgi:ribosomal protein S18 acetylase RimI-like enzyme